FPHALTHILLLSLLILSLLSPHLHPLLNFPLIIVLTLILSLFIFLLIKFTPLFEDSATSIVTYLSLALALLIANKTSQYDITLLNYLFGSLIIVSKIDALESFLVLLISAFLYLKYKELWLTQCIEREVPGVNFKKSQLIFLLLITLQTIIGVKLMGVLLVSAFFVYSGVLALRISPSFKWVFPLNALFNLLAIIFGFLLSILFDLPFSASAILFMSLYIILIFLKRS
ncbi:MAG: metal ABC transporter permease, partial [Caldimicrobium sp.]